MLWNVSNSASAVWEAILKRVSHVIEDALFSLCA